MKTDQFESVQSQRALLADTVSAFRFEAEYAANQGLIKLFFDELGLSLPDFLEHLSCITTSEEAEGEISRCARAIAAILTEEGQAAES